AVTATGMTITATAASGGTAPITYQWHRATSAEFTPGGGNVVAGATSLTLEATGLDPETAYYWQCVATDAAEETAASNEVSATTEAAAIEPMKIIFDTDMSSDCDDAGALAVAHYLVDQGACEIIAMGVSDLHEYSAP